MNPVAAHDSIDALDLLTRVVPVLRKAGADPALIAAVVEQKIRHWRALEELIGGEPLTTED